MQRIFENFKNHILAGNSENTVQKYLATDDPLFWLPNEDKTILEERTKTYTYKFNDHGFRCDDFSESSEFPLLFLGCSNTCGVGLEIEHTWQYVLLDKIKIHNHKNIPLWSLATPGSSIDKQAILLERYIDMLRPKCLFFLIPSLYRRLFAVNNEIIEYLPAHRTQFWRPQDVTDRVNKFDSAFVEEDYAIFESYKNLLLINRLAAVYDSFVYWDSWCDGDDYKILEIICGQLSQFKCLNIPYHSDQCARDGSHAGPNTHRFFAPSPFDKIKKDYLI